MFKSLRQSAGALRGLEVQLVAIRQILEERSLEVPQEPLDLSPLTNRLDRLEVGYAKWQAEAEATLLKADALFKNSRNAEERTRSKQAKIDEADAEGSLESEEFALAYERWVQDRDAEGGADNGLQGVRPGVEIHPGRSPAKALRLRAKFR